jgi:hypothetical protein
VRLEADAIEEHGHREPSAEHRSARFTSRTTCAGRGLRLPGA